MDNKGNILIYESADGSTQLDVRLENETVWLSTNQMALLFQKDRTVIGRHIRNAYKEGEIEENITCANFAHTTRQGNVQFFTKN